MELLNALPESVKGCLLEAARLCGSGVGAAQQRLLRASSAQVGPSTSVQKCCPVQGRGPRKLPQAPLLYLPCDIANMCQTNKGHDQGAGQHNGDNTLVIGHVRWTDWADLCPIFLITCPGALEGCFGRCIGAARMARHTGWAAARCLSCLFSGKGICTSKYRSSRWRLPSAQA